MKKSKRAAEELRRQITTAKKKLKDAKSFLESMAELKRFAPEMLGNGLSNGGPVKCRDCRFEVLNRLRSHGVEFSAQQANDWSWFKKEWDDKMKTTWNKEWGLKFAEMVQHLAEELEKGNASAVADFMYTETCRVLSDVPTLRV